MPPFKPVSLYSEYLYYTQANHFRFSNVNSLANNKGGCLKHPEGQNTGMKCELPNHTQKNDDNQKKNCPFCKGFHSKSAISEYRAFYQNPYRMLRSAEESCRIMDEVYQKRKKLAGDVVNSHPHEFNGDLNSVEDVNPKKQKLCHCTCNKDGLVEEGKSARDSQMSFFHYNYDLDRISYFEKLKKFDKLPTDRVLSEDFKERSTKNSSNNKFQTEQVHSENFTEKSTKNLSNKFQTDQVAGPSSINDDSKLLSERVIEINATSSSSSSSSSNSSPLPNTEELLLTQSLINTNKYLLSEHNLKTASQSYANTFQMSLDSLKFPESLPESDERLNFQDNQNFTLSTQRSTDEQTLYPEETDDFTFNSDPSCM